METFNFDYDGENDDLFIYIERKKSAGAIEVGDFVMDFDEKENLVAIQILNASEILSKLISRVVSLAKITKIQAEVIEFRNMNAVDIHVQIENRNERVPIIIPTPKRSSPVLDI